jgi:Skp family chaperone for outer membrane proteins
MKIAPAVLVAVTAAFIASPVLAAPKPKPINYEARAKACDAKLKGQYNFETKVVARGFCLSNVQQDVYQEAKR